MSMTVESLSFSYGERRVLNNVNFEADYGEFLSVLGPNGVGKSTLFKCMLGLLKPSNGGAVIDGIPISKFKAAQLARRIAYIPQSHNPVFNFSVFDMVLMGTTAQINSFETPRKEHMELADEALERLGIADLRERGYGNLSGGERQLVLIARAIAQKANILVMDEPSSSLDFGNRIKVMQTIRSLTHDGYAVIQSTHDPDQAYLYSDKVLALYAGEVLAWGTPAETICKEVISVLYGVKVDVCSLRNDEVRCCVPAAAMYRQ